MCGIVGCFEIKRKVNAEVVHRMMDILKHRGPDDAGYEPFEIAGGNLGMGFVRLSIRDLSSAGHQPMFNANKDIAVTLNGEIYNADELRQPLINAGYSFNSTSDTEVLLYLYEFYGLDKMLPMIDGMYAICIVDKRNDCFYLIRDRLGEKPLYLYETDNVLLYASEYKAFYCHPDFKADLNESVVDEYFLFRYISDGDTLLKGVHNLRPGSYLKVSADGQKHVVYWDFPNVKPNNLSYEENKKKYYELLKTSLRRRLISDREVGLQLSGGVDSSYMAHLIPQITGEQLHTFSVVFADRKYTEEKYQKKVVEQEKCDAHYYEYNSDMFFDCWRECTYYLEAPMNHEGSIGLLLLNRRSKDIVTVMLCGEGADETLGGYNHFLLMRSMMKHPSLHFAYTLLNWHRGNGWRWSLDDTLIGTTQSVPSYMFSRLRDNGSKRIENVYKKRRKILSETAGRGVRRYMNYDTKTFMQDLLIRADKTSMASSIEMRVPYIMPELVELVCQIPDKHLVKSLPIKTIPNSSKRILKDLCTEVYGKDFTNRPKVGFTAPLLDFFRAPEVASYIEHKLLPGIKDRGVVNYEEVMKMWQECLNTTGNKLPILWPLWLVFSFELWAQMYLDNTPLNWQHVDI